MSNSPLATLYVPAYGGNYTKGRSAPISEITVHHMAGRLRARRCGEVFQTARRCGSAHYGIGYDGEIARYVDEKDTAWTNSHWESNCRAVTVEVSNSEAGNPWRVSEKSMNSLVSLIADIARRNGLGKLEKGKNLTWHSMYANTLCPGEYLLSRLDSIIARANEINEKALTVTNERHPLYGRDIYRDCDRLVLYTKGTSSKTNRWGFEVPLDKNGVVLSSPRYGGNTRIPTGGSVLSGHGEAGKWIYANAEKGFRITESGGNIHIDRHLHRSADGVNTSRGRGHLCVYTKGERASTNKYGYEVAVQKGYALSDPVYGVGKTKIPEDGFVLSGHLTKSCDSGGEWIYANIREGSPVTYERGVVKLL